MLTRADGKGGKRFDGRPLRINQILERCDCDIEGAIC